MAVPVANPVMNLVNVKDSRWLTLEVCREFQRNKCTRTETECKFAHPPPHVEVQNGRVTCCFDSIKGKCQRKDPPCKYLHPPQHLKEQLLQNGRNNLILKNLQMQAMAAGTFPVMPQMVPVGVYEPSQAAGVATSKPVYPTVLPSQLNQLLGLQQISDNTLYARTHSLNPSPYAPGIGPTAVPNAFNQYIIPGVLPNVTGGIPAVDTPPTSISGAATVGVPQSIGAAPNSKITRPDRLEVCREFQRGTCTRQPSECRFAHPPENVTVDTTDNHVTVCMDYVKGKCNREACRYYHPPPHLQAQIKACQQRASVMAAAQAQALQGMTVPGMVPYVKRPAMADGKSGVPMYQPGTGTTAYQQALAAMQMQQQSFVPAVTIAGPHPGMPRF